MTKQIGIWILQAFQEPWIQFFLLPLLAALVTILLRSISRPNKASVFEFKREDFLVGIGLGVTGFLTLATTLFKVSERYAIHTKAFADAQAAQNSALATKIQLQVTDLFTYLFGLTGFFVIFLLALIFMALQMSHHGWETPTPGAAPEPRIKYLVGYDALGLLLLSVAIYIMGEL